MQISSTPRRDGTSRRQPRPCLRFADRFVFDIDVRFPLVGELVHYRGWLAQKSLAKQ
jgi:hypothetical protein